MNVINVGLYLTATDLKLDSEFMIINDNKLTLDFLEVLREGFKGDGLIVKAAPVSPLRDEVVQPANEFHVKKAKKPSYIREKYSKKGVNMNLPEWATFEWNDLEG